MSVFAGDLVQLLKLLWAVLVVVWNETVTKDLGLRAAVHLLIARQLAKKSIEVLIHTRYRHAVPRRAARPARSVIVFIVTREAELELVVVIISGSASARWRLSNEVSIFGRCHDHRRHWWR